jgi:hypothetical protein
MSCEECDKQDGSRIAYFRIGNEEIGWGNIGLIGCEKHLQLALKRLRKE